MLGQNETIRTFCFCSHNTTAVSPKEFFFSVLLVMSLFNIFIMKKVLDFAFMLFYTVASEILKCLVLPRITLHPRYLSLYYLCDIGFGCYQV